MVVMAYRTRDRLADYGFSIEFQSDSGWRVYLVFLPHHQNDKDSRLPYLSIDHVGRRYVDWSGYINDLGEARTVAELWAEIAQSHQRSGVQSENDAAAVKNASTKEAATAQQRRADAA
jgi:hypothetical protein